MKIAVFGGDGIGVDVTAQAVKVLKALPGAERFEMEEGPLGEEGIQRFGDALPPASLELAHRADAVLLGATGVPADENRKTRTSAGFAVLRLRVELKLFATSGLRFSIPNSSALPL